LEKGLAEKVYQAFLPEDQRAGPVPIKDMFYGLAVIFSTPEQDLFPLLLSLVGATASALY
jgi:hypothetical protein